MSNVLAFRVPRSLILVATLKTRVSFFLCEALQNTDRLALQLLHSFNMVYIRASRLPGLKEYKYSAVDKSLTSKYILKPFYTNVVIKCFPMSMA